MSNMTDKLHEECGVFAMFDNDGFDTARITYAGLFALQHRGQESAGIAINKDRELPYTRIKDWFRKFSPPMYLIS